MKPIKILWAVILLANLFSCAKKDENAQRNKELEAFYQRQRFSGAHWADKYPWSRSTADLKSPFREQVIDFIAALEEAGATVVIENTFRPTACYRSKRYEWNRDARNRIL